MERTTLAAYGAALIAVSSLCDGFGRIFWGLNSCLAESAMLACAISCLWRQITLRTIGICPAPILRL